MSSTTHEYNSSNATHTRTPTNRQSPFAGTQLEPVDDVVEYVKTYARQNPGTAALWCFGVGFIIGWKLKPW
ncbi:MAG: hypothetical protein KDA84_24895 [Planctomycetaceae bacterium]|nr:hypothetical protein [Planctomycetaceae bacterium]